MWVADRTVRSVVNTCHSGRFGGEFTKKRYTNVLYSTFIFLQSHKGTSAQSSMRPTNEPDRGVADG